MTAVFGYLAWYVCILCSHTESAIDIYFGQLSLMNMRIDQDYWNSMRVICIFLLRLANSHNYPHDANWSLMHMLITSQCDYLVGLSEYPYIFTYECFVLALPVRMFRIGFLYIFIINAYANVGGWLSTRFA